MEDQVQGNTADADTETLIRPAWAAPADVVAMVTTRVGGCSKPPYDTFNLALHVGDDAAAVEHNRAALERALPDPVPVQWLTQVHGTDVFVPGNQPLAEKSVVADAAYQPAAGLAVAVLTADCLPVLFADSAGSRAVAAAHAGWRGLADGVLENTVARFSDPQTVLAWLGPAIGPCHFEVGPEVREIFLGRGNSQQQAELQAAFRPSGDAGRWMADIYAIARLRLRAAGLRQISGGNFCTVCDTARFYSYRRDGVSGRMASLIYRRPR